MSANGAEPRWLNDSPGSAGFALLSVAKQAVAVLGESFRRMLENGQNGVTVRRCERDESSTALDSAANAGSGIAGLLARNLGEPGDEQASVRRVDGYAEQTQHGPDDTPTPATSATERTATPTPVAAATPQSWQARSAYNGRCAGRVFLAEATT
jgi:hypothetical protein